jgi:hypothetical protein
MKKLVLLAVLFAICVPGYAEVIVYKLNANFKMIQYIDPNRTVTKKSTVDKTIKAYIVFNIDSNTPLHTVRLDAGNKPMAILYGDSKTEGKWKKTIGGEDVNSAVLISTAESEVLGFQTFNTYTPTGKTEQRMSATFTLIDEPNGVQPFEIVADTKGKAKKTGQDLFSKTIYLTWNFSGNTSMRSGDTESENFVTGQCSGKLKLNFSKMKSAVNNDWNVAETIADIDASDTLDGYPDIGSAPIPVP